MYLHNNHLRYHQNHQILLYTDHCFKYKRITLFSKVASIPDKHNFILGDITFALDEIPPKPKQDTEINKPTHSLIIISPCRYLPHTR